MRSIIGFAIFAVVAWILLKIFLGLLGTVFGLAVTILTWAVIGYVFYLVLKLIAPGTAARLRSMVRGRPEHV